MKSYGVFLVLLTCGVALAQTPARLEFEVATVRSSPPPPGDLININLGNVRNGKLIFTNASLSDCLKFAYGIVSDAQLVGPDWIKSKAVRFDVVAQVPPETSREEIQLMLQSLLAERLKVVLHHESRVLPMMALVPAKGGPRLQEALTGPGAANGNPATRGRITANQMSMQLLATLLSRFERRTVVDFTGLKGLFSFRLEWIPDDIRPVMADGGGASAGLDLPAGPSLTTALREQLGLALEPRKGPLDILVVDSAEKIPSEN